jgi:transcriptional regulator with XRE-family HTH domain
VSDAATKPAALQRPKTLGKLCGSPRKRELARVYRMAREAAGLTQRELADRLGIQQKHVALCELADEPHTFTTAHLIDGPTEWSLPIMRGVIGHHRAQILEAVETVSETHAVLLAETTGECMGVMHAQSLLIAKLNAQADDGQPAELEIVQSKARGGLKALLRVERKATVALMRARGGK